MRLALSVMLVALVATLALAQEVRLSLAFVPSSSATRIVTGKVSGEWNGPTPLSPTKPTSFLFDLSVRCLLYTSPSPRD